MISVDYRQYCHLCKQRFLFFHISELSADEESAWPKTDSCSNSWLNSSAALLCRDLVGHTGPVKERASFFLKYQRWKLNPELLLGDPVCRVNWAHIVRTINRSSSKRSRIDWWWWWRSDARGKSAPTDLKLERRSTSQWLEVDLERRSRNGEFGKFSLPGWKWEEGASQQKHEKSRLHKGKWLICLFSCAAESL